MHCQSVYQRCAAAIVQLPTRRRRDGGRDAGREVDHSEGTQLNAAGTDEGRRIP